MVIKLLVDILLSYDNNVNYVNKDCWSPLMIVCKNGHMYIALKLLEHDANTTIKNSKGRTAAEIALENRHNEIYKIIQEKFANEAENLDEIMTRSNNTSSMTIFESDSEDINNT
ncbi:hypothetical protein Bpfe_002440 [Biomphalaria pfeifferi]|uniref:Ankyrin repeat protein n=1 Tax=Biomphalaria pfeifferi TaxID=112525 RepID=A0AAD8CAM3_BIOPF|nr:hypothetical protein Bpfe_002440 [Biomphalaria pfeifferi]